MLLFPAMNENMNMDEYLQNLPEELKAFIPSISGSIDTLPGWLDLEMFSLIAPFSLPFLVIIMGARAIAGREENGRIDLLLSNPIPRWSLVLATLVNMVLSLSVALAVIGALTWLPTLLIEEDLGLGQLVERARFPDPVLPFLRSLRSAALVHLQAEFDRNRVAGRVTRGHVRGVWLGQL